MKHLLIVFIAVTFLFISKEHLAQAKTVEPVKSDTLICFTHRTAEYGHRAGMFQYAASTKTLEQFETRVKEYGDKDGVLNMPLPNTRSMSLCKE